MFAIYCPAVVPTDKRTTRQRLRFPSGAHCACAKVLLGLSAAVGGFGFRAAIQAFDMLYIILHADCKWLLLSLAKLQKAGLKKLIWKCIA